VAQGPVALLLIIVVETTAGKHILALEVVQELLAGAVLPMMFG